MDKLTIKMIKQKFPNPVAADSANDEGQYCVGGAFIRMYNSGFNPGFPRAWLLKSAIDSYRDQVELPYRTDISDLAEEITEQNDSGNFDAAWEALGKALNGN